MAMNMVQKLRPAEALAYYPYDRSTTKPLTWFMNIIQYNQIAKIRKSIGLTQSEMAFCMDTTQTNISRIERKDFKNESIVNITVYACRYQNAFIFYKIAKEDNKNAE